MATRVYGAWQGAAATGKVTQRAYLDYTVTVNSNDTYTINVSSSGIDPWNDKWTQITVDSTYGATGVTTNSYQNQITTTAASTGVAIIGNRNYSYSKTHSSQSKTVFMTTTLNHVTSSGGGAYVNGKTSTASVTFTIPARTSYSVTYNANGGTGASNKATAKQNLGITYGTSAPSGGSTGDIYLQYTT